MQPYHIPVRPRERWFVLFGITVYVLLIGIVVLSNASTELTYSYIALMVYIGIMCLPLLMKGRKLGWFDPLVFGSLWTLARWVLPRTPLFMFGLTSHPALPEYDSAALTELLARSLLLESMALLISYVGFFLPVPNLFRFSLRFREPKYVIFKMGVVAVVSLLAFGVLAYHAGGIQGLLLQRGLRVDERVLTAVGRHWSVIVGCLTVACLVWASMSPRAYSRPIFWFFVILGSGLEYIVTGSRSGLLLPLIAHLIIWSVQRGRIPWTRVFVWAIVSIALVGVLGQFRASTFGAASLAEVRLDTSLFDAFRSGITEMLTHTSASHSIYPILARVPRDVDYLYGESYISIMVAPIPRALWSEKPIAVGRMASTVFYNNPWNTIPTGAVGEAYWNLGIIGVVVVFLLWGMFLRQLSHMIARNTFGAGTLVLYVITILYLAPNTEPVYAWLQRVGPALLVLLWLCGTPVVASTRAIVPRGPEGLAVNYSTHR